MVLNLQTSSRDQFIDITDQIQEQVQKAGLEEGAVIVYCPHTTAGVTINEHADPDVVHDILLALDRLVPWVQTGFRHREGNSPSHIKALLTGPSVLIPVQRKRLMLGTWQGVFFCEFDGPRQRKVYLSFLRS